MPLPSWFLAFVLHPSLGRWLLVLQVAVSGNYASFSGWDSANQSPVRPARLGEGPCNSPDCSAGAPFQTTQWLEMEDPGFQSGTDRSHPNRDMAGRVRSCLVRAGVQPRDFAETVHVMVQRLLLFKNFMAGPWRLFTTWESIWPVKVHSRMPLPVLEATVSTTSAWNWTRFALLPLVSLYALLRSVLVCQRLSDEFGDWLSRRHLYQTAAGQIKDSRCKDAKCRSRVSTCPSLSLLQRSVSKPSRQKSTSSVTPPAFSGLVCSKRFTQPRAIVPYVFQALFDLEAPRIGLGMRTSLDFSGEAVGCILGRCSSYSRAGLRYCS